MSILNLFIMVEFIVGIPDFHCPNLSLQKMRAVLCYLLSEVIRSEDRKWWSWGASSLVHGSSTPRSLTSSPFFDNEMPTPANMKSAILSKCAWNSSGFFCMNTSLNIELLRLPKSFAWWLMTESCFLMGDEQ